MGNNFSDHFNSSGTVGPGEGALAEALGLDSQRRAGGGIGHSRLRWKRAKITVGTDVGIGDQIRMMSMKSGDRIHEFYFTSDGGTTAGAVDIGVYETGIAHDGALPSANCVDQWSTTAVTVTTAVARVTRFALGDVASINRGDALWEMVNLSDAATYTVDPLISFDLTMTATIAFTASVATMLFEVFYTSGD